MLDLRFPGTKYGIPVLDIGCQATAIEPPWVIWGQHSRKRVLPGGTYCFYTKDYKFSGLWARPDSLPASGVTAAVEPNYSTGPLIPEALTIWRTYQKRWIARYWQTLGIKILVDLNVDQSCLRTSVLGVPRGWGAYATRAQRGTNWQIMEQFKVATEIRDGRPELFLVYGGGESAKSLCEDNGWLWIPEHINVMRGTKQDHNKTEV